MLDSFRPGALLVAAYVISVANSANAQVRPVLPSRQQLSPVDVAPPPAPRDRSGLFEQLPAGPCPFADSSLRFTLSTVRIEGLTALPSADLAPAWEEQVGKEISVSALCEMRDAIATALLRRNILARVEIPQQEIVDGTVRFEIIQGRIEGVVVEGDPGPARGLIEKTLAPLAKAEFIDLDVAQRYILLASDIPGVSLSMLLAPGTSRGGLVLRAVAARKAITAQTVVQNLNSISQGRVVSVARVDFNSLTPWGDRTTVVAAVSGDLVEQRVYQVMHEARLTASGLVARGSVALGLGAPGGDIAPLELRTRSLISTIELTYPLTRHRRRNLSIGGGLELADQRTRVFRNLLFSDERARVAYLRLSGDLSSRFGEMPAYLASSVELRRGMSILSASDRGSALLTRAEADPEAFVLRGTFNGSITPVPVFTLAVAGQAQYADRPLVSYEQFAIGNLTIGRGYDPNAFPADRGAAFSVELQSRPFDLADRFQIAPFAFTDVAHVVALGFGGGERTLTSIGGGMRFTLLSLISGNVTYARPLNALTAGGRRPTDRVLFTLAARFR